MKMIDEEGNLIGRVNIIDALVVLLLSAIVLAGVVLVTSYGIASATNITTVTVSTTVSPAVVSAIEEAEPAPDTGVRSIGDVEIVDTVLVNSTEYTNASRTHKVVEVEVLLETESRDGLLYFQGERLYVGSELDLDLTKTVINCTVVDLHRGLMEVHG